MKRSRRSFIWMSIILELSLMAGIFMYVLAHTACNDDANEGGVSQPAEAELFLLPRDEIIDYEDESTDMEGGPYAATPVLQVSIHKAKNGDSLWTVAKKHDLDFYTLLSINRLDKANRISIGQKLKIPNQRGLLHMVQKGDTIEDISLTYNVGIRKVIRVNSILDPSEIKPGTELFIPGATVSLAYSKELLKKSGIPPKFAWPCRRSTRISSRYGYRKDPFTKRRAFHPGTDFAAGYGSNVYSSMSGRVTHAGYLGGYGKLVVIRHANGYTTRYGHLSRILVRKGKYIGQGQVIGKVGNTGRSTGAHLHFEVRKNGRTQNPMKHLHR